jgi:glycosyltransferase involved in cell wall biosynthesis
MKKCIDSLLFGGEDVEIIIVDDGSTKDNTWEIAKSYQDLYPTIVKAVHKSNGGHGSGVNLGMAISEGLYFKVVDSDDWVNIDAYKTLLDKIKEHHLAQVSPDLYIVNYTYEHVEDNTQFTCRYVKQLPVNEFFGWKRVKTFRRSAFMMMHALVYKKDKLIASRTILPENTFYVDNIFTFRPLPFMKSIYYMDIDFYRYFIGRPDQSINIKNFVERYDQQILVMKRMLSSYRYEELMQFDNGLRRYMFHCLAVILLNTLLFTTAKKSQERKNALTELWAFMKSFDLKLYKKLKHRSYSIFVNYLPWSLKKQVLMIGYIIVRDKIKLG